MPDSGRPRRLRDQPLWQVSIVTSREADDAVGAMLERLFRQPFTVYEDEASGTAIVSVFLNQLRSERSRLAQVLKAGLRQIARFELDTSPGKVRFQRLWRRDWAESWKRHFKPFRVGGRLLVKPGWSRCRPGKDEAAVVLDPGLSFGTGQHPTTRFCLEQLVAFRTPARFQSCLDIGTGSGILVIAAAKLGYHPAHALDADPVAVRTARANARLNAVQSRVRIFRRNLTLLPGHCDVKYDVVCANLTAELLLAQSKPIINRLRTGGMLVLAGILRPQFATVKQKYVEAGFKQVTNRTDGEWRSIAMARG